MRSLTLACTASMLLSIVRAEAVPLRLAGSDLAGKPVQEALAAYARREGIEIAADLSGSHPAHSALLKGTADAALLLADPRRSPAADPAGSRFSAAGELQRVPVAALAAYVLVAADNPVEQLDFQQLTALFGSRAELRRWGELGGRGVWDNRSIAPALWSRRLSPVGGMFAHMVLEGAAPRAGLLEWDDAKTLLAAFSDQPGLIVLAPFSPSPGSGVRALRIARTPGFPASEPSPEAIATGDYPLRLPVELVFPSRRTAEIAPLLRFFATPEAASALEAAMLAPLPYATRARLLADSTR